MEVEEVVRLLEAADAKGVTIWLDGGQGVDALMGRVLRDHDDLDLIVELLQVPKLVEALTDAGYEQVAGTPPRSFVLVDDVGRQVDVHPVVFDDARDGGVYQMEDGREWVYPGPGFEGHGCLAGRIVRCLTAEVQVLVHDGYELTDKDFRELYLLHERFGVDIAAKYLDEALAARDE